jgi:putative ubiquitin-RnfH superfamily antitoxin RatB of RatAB toxin-antitoxin module
VTTEIEVELVRALPQEAESLRLRLPEGSTVAQALECARTLRFAPAQEASAEALAIFGRPATTATRLRDGDRIEILRPLLADPKQRRRERAGERKR